MAVKRARPTKKRLGTKMTPELDRKLKFYLDKANSLCFAVTLIVLKTQFGFGKKRMADFVEGYPALMQETNDGRMTVQGVIDYAKEVTGIDPDNFVENVRRNNYYTWLEKLKLYREKGIR